jgi:hypothetical protein
LGAALSGFRFHPFQGLGDVNDEARMHAASDRFDLVLRGDLERDLTAFDRRHRRGDLDRAGRIAAVCLIAAKVPACSIRNFCMCR